MPHDDAVGRRETEPLGDAGEGLEDLHPLAGERRDVVLELDLREVPAVG